MERLQVEAGQQAASESDFDGLIAPLERKARQGLSGPGRSTCRAAFAENAEGFIACCERVLERTNSSSPLGLLVRMVRDGDHRVPAVEKESSAAAAPAAPSDGSGECFVCGERATIREAGQWFCERDSEHAADGDERPPLRVIAGGREEAAA